MQSFVNWSFTVCAKPRCEVWMAKTRHTSKAAGDIWLPSPICLSLHLAYNIHQTGDLNTRLKSFPAGTLQTTGPSTNGLVQRHKLCNM